MQHTAVGMMEQNIHTMMASASTSGKLFCVVLCAMWRSISMSARVSVEKDNSDSPSRQKLRPRHVFHATWPPTKQMMV